MSNAASNAPLRQRLTRVVYRWWLTRFRYCFACDRRTLLTHKHSDVHGGLPWWDPR